MRKLLMLYVLILVATIAWIRPAYGYARVLVVEVYASPSVKVNEEVNVTAYIHTGNNIRESVTDVQAILILPGNAYLTSGTNPVFIGTMGPGPADAYCSWTAAHSAPGLYAVSVNVSCVDTQDMDRWLMNFTTIEVYDFPHAEFTCEGSNLYANKTVIFNATDSHSNALGALIVSYEWNFGDGKAVTTYNQVIEHVFQSVGNHEISLNVTDSRGLSNITSITIVVRLFGDLNSDNIVNILDISFVAICFGSHEGDETWDAGCDLNNDAVINILDVSKVAAVFGTTS